MNLHNLEHSAGSKHTKKRVGRGTSSGIGKTSGRGQKGQNARTGGGVRPGFEGGQTPIYRRIPKFGFTNIHQKKYTILNLSDLERLNLTEVNKDTLVAKKVIKNKHVKVKLLGNGEIKKAINCKVDKVSKSASEKIMNAGGKIE